MLNVSEIKALILHVSIYIKLLYPLTNGHLLIILLSGKQVFPLYGMSLYLGGLGLFCLFFMSFFFFFQEFPYSLYRFSPAKFL